MKKLAIFILSLALLGYVLGDRVDWFTPELPTGQLDGNDSVAYGFENKLNRHNVTGFGKVKTILKDDLKGSRHQRFILILPSGQTLLVAHNIDLAPRVEGLRKGDRIEFSGMYEYNDKGGVVHWTHHDPDARHAGGWLKHKQRLYR